MKKIFYSVILLLITLCTFFSCSTESTPSIVKGNISLSVANASENDAYQPLNYVPIDVANKMESDELSIWKKLSSCFYIDFSIINTKYYKKNKSSFLRDMLSLYEEAKTNQKTPQRLVFAFPTTENQTQFNLCELDDTMSIIDPDTNPDYGFGSDSTYVGDNPINTQTFVCERIRYRFTNANVYLCVSADIKITGTSENPTFTINNQNIFTDPSNAYFSGYAELSPADQGVNLDAKGRIVYRSAFANVNEHYYIKIILNS